MKRSTKFYVGIAIAVAIIIGAYLVFGQTKNNSADNSRVVTAERGDVVQDVSFSGNVKSSLSSDLSFEVAGTVTKVFVDTGDVVKKGDKLAQLDVRSAQLQLAQARAQRVAAQDQALIALQKANQDVAGTQKVNDKYLSKYRLAVIDAKSALDQAKDAYNATKDEYGDDSSTAKTKYSTVLSAESAYHNAQKVYSEQKDALNNTLATAKKAAELASAQYTATIQASLNTPGLSSLQAGENIAAIALAKSTLVAPFDGIIFSRDINEGELATVTKPVLGIQGQDSILEVTADVPETDAMKIKQEQKATITFDAFPSTEQYEATVKSVAPAAKVISGVPTFEVRLEISQLNEKIKAGLTANVVVHTAKRSDVINIQRRAITTRDGKQYVNVINENGTEIEREVTTGLLGSNGSVEIISGLNAGEKASVSTVK